MIENKIFNSFYFVLKKIINQTLIINAYSSKSMYIKLQYCRFQHFCSLRLYPSLFFTLKTIKVTKLVYLKEL